ncbi:MAG TPA: serine hydrolase [Terriglobales bacterium]|nr:serine hydrolase [Terriglobales bacterium]
MKTTSIILVFVLCAYATAFAQAALDSRLAVVGSVIDDAIAQQQIPGAVLIVGHDGQVVYRMAYGSRAIEPRREAMTLDTVFDCASLTKVIATTTAIMQLWEQGKFRMNDPVAKYLPEFGQNGKQDITIRQLLVHYSGLPEDLDLTKKWEGKDTAYRMAFEMAPDRPPGSAFVYSDINFAVLGALVERLSGESLDEYSAKHIFVPLNMKDTRFLPPASWASRIAPTEEDENHHLLRAVVHDPTARRMGGVAGHAGVFSTADDLAIFAQALLDGGRGMLTSPTIAKMTAPQQPVNATTLRGFGWDIDSPFSTNRGELLPVGSFGHTGFTGTSLWIDPTTKTYIVLMTNAVHMNVVPEVKARNEKARNEKVSAASLRTKVATAVAAALALDPSEAEKMRLAAITGYNEMQSAARKLAVRNGTVKTGIDVLEETKFAALHPGRGGAPKSIGLLTNQTGIDSEGRRTIDVLANVPGISLDAIFSPEHGVEGTLDKINVKNTKDAATGVVVYSVYGGSDAARRPSIELLKHLDAVVIDIADAGARFYTYETTVGFFLEAAAKAGIEVIILDRPNPVTGSFVQGPVSDEGHESFTNYFPEPPRQGMTLGELAKMFNAERHIGAQLNVVAMQGWQPGDWFDSTGLVWVNPSPSLRDLTQATLYHGVAMIEGTNVSVGRGTDTPFEVVGAPWIKGRELAAYLNGRGIQSVRFVPIVFTPSGSNFAGERCEGVNLVLQDRNTLDSPEMGIELASALHKLYPNDFKLGRMSDLLVNQAVFDAIAAGVDPRRIAADWQDRLDQFVQLREKYLLYKVTPK